jgi:hypothetical protein
MQSYLVKIHVQQLCAALHLFASHSDGSLKVVLFDCVEKRARTGHVAALANVHKIDVWSDVKMRHARKTQKLFRRRRNTQSSDGNRRHSLCNVLNVMWISSTTSAHHVSKTVSSKLPHLFTKAKEEQEEKKISSPPILKNNIFCFLQLFFPLQQHLNTWFR